MIFLLLLACRGAKLGDSHDTAGTDTDTDTAVDTDADTASACLLLDPTSLALSGSTYTGLVAVSGCVDELAATCDTVPFTVEPSMAVQGSWIVNAVGATAPTSGTCTWTSTEGTAALPVSYTP